MEKYYSFNEAAEIVPFKPRTLQRWAVDGKINATKVGTTWVVAESELKRLMEGGATDEEE